MLIPSKAKYINNNLLVDEYIEVEPYYIAKAILDIQKGYYEQNKKRIIEEKPVLPPKT